MTDLMTTTGSDLDVSGPDGQDSGLSVQMAQTAADGSFRTAATSQGRTSGIVSSQWFSRPADQRYLDLASLQVAVRARRDTAKVATIEAKEIEIVSSMTDKFDLRVRDRSGALGDDDMEPSNYSFGQLCGLVKAPSGYLRGLPGALAAMNLQYGLASDRRETVKMLRQEMPVAADPLGKPHVVLSAATGADYGRIWDHEVVEAVQGIAARYPFKVPGQIDWASGNGTTYRYNPYVDVTRETTTLYASDRDVFMFLVDDTRPIVIGRLPNGEDDVVFRGFYVSNSEVGAGSLKGSVFYLRGVCCNRMLWGVEGGEIRIRHSKFAPEKFASDAMPQLIQFASQSDQLFLQGVKAAKAAIVASDDDGAKAFLEGRGFSKPMVSRVLETVLQEEGHEARSIWDLVQGLTAVARRIDNTDSRMDLELRAGRLLDKVQLV